MDLGFGISAQAPASLNSVAEEARRGAPPSDLAASPSSPRGSGTWPLRLVLGTGSQSQWSPGPAPQETSSLCWN